MPSTDEEVAISSISIAELHFGVLVAPDDDARAIRLQRLAIVEDLFGPLPFEATAARECGRLQAAIAKRGGRARRRAFDLAIAATANVHGSTLVTANASDFKLIEDLVDLRSPKSGYPGGLESAASPLPRRRSRATPNPKAQSTAPRTAPISGIMPPWIGGGSRPMRICAFTP